MHFIAGVSWRIHIIIHVWPFRHGPLCFFEWTLQPLGSQSQPLPKAHALLHQLSLSLASSASVSGCEANPETHVALKRTKDSKDGAGRPGWCDSVGWSI